jgi:hypothetical protein
MLTRTGWEGRTRPLSRTRLMMDYSFALLLPKRPSRRLGGAGGMRGIFLKDIGGAPMSRWPDLPRAFHVATTPCTPAPGPDTIQEDGHLFWVGPACSHQPNSKDGPLEGRISTLQSPPPSPTLTHICKTHARRAMDSRFHPFSRGILPAGGWLLTRPAGDGRDALPVVGVKGASSGVVREPMPRHPAAAGGSRRTRGRIDKAAREEETQPAARTI